MFSCLPSVKATGVSQQTSSTMRSEVKARNAMARHLKSYSGNHGEDPRVLSVVRPLEAWIICLRPFTLLKGRVAITCTPPCMEGNPFSLCNEVAGGTAEQVDCMQAHRSSNVYRGYTMATHACARQKVEVSLCGQVQCLVC
jgi:hypothetical protein